MTTTAGSLALEGSIPPRDSHIAERLRAAGAILLAKANLSEWANIRSNALVQRLERRGAGSAGTRTCSTAIPAARARARRRRCRPTSARSAVGTETDGSIVCPASANGVVGIKPTVGLVSRAGIIPISHTQDTAGPALPDGADAAALLSAVAGDDPRDPATASGRRPHRGGLHPRSSTGPACAAPASAWRGPSSSATATRPTGWPKRRSASCGAKAAILVDPADIPTPATYDDAELEVLLYELKADLNAYLATLGPTAPVRTLADVIAFNERERAREMPYFGQELFVQAEAKGPLTAPAYRKALAICRRLARTAGLDAVLAKHNLDAIVAPTGNPAWPTDPVNGDHFTGSSSTPAAVAGYPSVSVPMGYAWGLPVNLSFFGGAWSEPTLIRLAYAFEQITMHRKAPKFLPTLA